MKLIYIFFLFLSLIVAHDPLNNDSARWTHYSRVSFVQDANQQPGAGVYSRFKRVKGYQFNDVRLFGNILKNDQFIFLRHKSSTIFSSYPKWYRFTTISYEKNTLANVSLRYHYNNGLGFFLQKNDQGNMTAEVGLAYDMTDYLNDSWKTSYVKTTFTWDTEISILKSKVELEYFSQISDIVESDLSRFQALCEMDIPITKTFSAIFSIFQELSKETSFDPSATTFSYSIGWEKPIKGKYLK